MCHRPKVVELVPLGKEEADFSGPGCSASGQRTEVAEDQAAFLGHCLDIVGLRARTRAYRKTDHTKRFDRLVREAACLVEPVEGFAVPGELLRKGCRGTETPGLLSVEKIGAE